MSPWLELGHTPASMLITDKVNRILLTGLDQYGSRPGGCNGSRGHLGGEGYMHKEGEGGN